LISIICELSVITTVATPGNTSKEFPPKICPVLPVCPFVLQFHHSLFTEFKNETSAFVENSGISNALISVNVSSISTAACDSI